MATIPPPPPAATATKIPLPPPPTRPGVATTARVAPTPPVTAPPEVTLIQPTLRSPALEQSTTFAQASVKLLRESDFTLGAKELVTVNSNDCMLILFYAENRESKNLALVWAEAAAQVAGPVFAAVNLLMEKKVAEAFTRLSSDINHPLHWAGMQGLPFILVYRQGWPVSFYNGERTVETLIDYALTLACQANYHEPQQLAGGMQAENRFEMTMTRPFAPRTSSTQFVATNPIRGYDARFTPVIRGSGEEQKEIQVAQATPTPPAPPRIPPPPARAPSGIPIGRSPTAV